MFYGRENEFKTIQHDRDKEQVTLYSKWFHICIPRILNTLHVILKKKKGLLTSIWIKTPERELPFFAKAKKSGSVKNFPLFRNLGFRNNVKFEKGFDIEAAILAYISSCNT